MKEFFWGCCIALAGPTAQGQVAASSAYPMGYFRNPLDIPMKLAANFGELRTNHFHMGLDIRTEKRENLPVHAAADGYVARIRIEPQGFGQAIYINHPNGYTTLYAHLNDFMPALSAYIRAKQYSGQTWAIQLEFSPNQFPVTRGGLIGYSGNTGGSQGPHLHFEIRATAQDLNLNPLSFGLPVEDRVSPVIKTLAVYNTNRSLYEQTPRTWAVRRDIKGFAIQADTIFSESPSIGFGIEASDAQSGSTNPNGLFQADIYDNDNWVIGFQMDKISYAQTHDINGHIDYKTKAAGGPLFQLLFRLPGNPLSIYRPAEASGKIDLGDMRLHHIRMELQDANGNKSALLANIIFHGSHQADSPTAPGEIFYPHQLNAVEKAACAFYVGENGMYDSAHIPYASVLSTTPGSVSQVHQIGATGIPLRDGILIRIRPNQDLGPGKMQKVLMQRIAGANQEVRKVEWLGGWAAARFDEFGSFQLLIDEEAPRISPIGFKDGANLKKAQRIQIAVKDNHNLVRAFRAELDGHWLRFSNDKEKAFVYTFDAHCPAGKHRLRVSAEDEAGNTAVKTFTFSR